MTAKAEGNGKALAPASAFRRDIEAMKPELERALRSRIPADYFARVLVTTVQRTPKLLECERLSLLGSIMEAAQLGLLPDGVTGYGYLIPYYNSRAKRYEAQFQPGYKGYVQMAYRGGSITKIVGREVREGDEFEYRLGTDEWIHHTPSTGERGNVTHFYAVAWQKEGPPIFVVLPRERVDTIRERAKAKNRGKDTPAWAGDYVAMGRKTAVRELFRWLPLDAEAHRVAGEDERFDAGEEPAREVDAEVIRKGAMDALLQDDGGEPGTEVEPEVEMKFGPCPSCEGKESADGCEACGGSGEVPVKPDDIGQAWAEGEDARAEEVKA